MKKIFSYLLGNPFKFDLKHRISNAVILIGIVLGFLSSLFNYLLNLPAITIDATVITALVLIVSYILSRFKGLFLVPVYINLIISLGLYTPVMWISNGGSSGSFQFYLFVYATFVIAVIRNKKAMLLLIGMILALTVFLLYYEYHFPEKIFRYADPKERFYDMIIGFTSVLLGISALLYVYTNEYSKTNLELSIKNKQLENQKFHINESIDYAKKIQKAVLSSYDVLKKNVKDSFLLYLPKEKISGDFYYFAKNGKRLTVVVADSTGHGIPGGFMSMLGITMLEEIINKEEIDDAGSALNTFREKIILALDQDTGKFISGDGFDVAYCIIDTETNRINYAGANIPLLILRNKFVHLIEPDDIPVGKYPHMKVFKNHYFDIQKDDIFYLFTDGLTDQFGGDKIQKFSLERLKKGLIEHSDEPLSVQKERFKKTYRDWRGKQKRTDDTMILGIKMV